MIIRYKIVSTISTTKLSYNSSKILEKNTMDSKKRKKNIRPIATNKSKTILKQFSMSRVLLIQIFSINLTISLVINTLNSLISLTQASSGLNSLGWVPFFKIWLNADKTNGKGILAQLMVLKNWKKFKMTSIKKRMKCKVKAIKLVKKSKNNKN